MNINKYDTLVNALADLSRRGYTESFRTEQAGLRSLGSNSLFRPADLTIVEFHRFEGDSAPDDMSIVYAVEATDGTRGTVVDAFGTYADALLARFLQEVKIKQEAPN